MNVHTTTAESVETTTAGAAPGPSRRSKGPRRMAVALALAAMTMFGTLAGGTGTADAWAWSSHVKVAGNISCENRGVVGTPRVSIRLSNGESGSASVNWLNNYGMQFRHIPSAGASGTATVTCPTWTGTRTFTRSVRVFRPAVGDQISINFRG
jgi:hypothetical protein